MCIEFIHMVNGTKYKRNTTYLQVEQYNMYEYDNLNW